MARTRRDSKRSSDRVTWPECGKTFARPAALGAHRRRAHGVVGATARAREAAAVGGSGASRRRGGRRAQTNGGSVTGSRRATADGGVDRDTLLRALFPKGIPPKEDVVRSVNAWLDEAERLSRLR
jgi:hypothetical protein